MKTISKKTTGMIALLSAAALFAGSHFAAAQFGHPLEGTWSGYWSEPDSDRRNRVLLLLQYPADYGNDAITGVINPGPRPVQISRGTLDADSWTVVLQGSRNDADGNTIEYRIEGRIENVTSASERSMSGVWIQGDRRGEFHVSLN